MTPSRSHSQAVMEPVLTVQFVDACARALAPSLPIPWVEVDHWRKPLSPIRKADTGHFSETQGTFSYNSTWVPVYARGHVSCKYHHRLWLFPHPEFLTLTVYEEFPSVGFLPGYNLRTGCSSFKASRQQNRSLGLKLLSKGF